MKTKQDQTVDASERELRLSEFVALDDSEDQSINFPVLPLRSVSQ